MRRSRLNYTGYYLLTGVIAGLFARLFIFAINNTSYRYHEVLLIIIMMIYMIETGIKISLTYGRLRDMDKNPHLAWLVILPFVWLYFAFAKGTEGENQYGLSPAQLKKLKRIESQK